MSGDRVRKLEIRKDQPAASPADKKPFSLLGRQFRRNLEIEPGKAPLRDGVELDPESLEENQKKVRREDLERKVAAGHVEQRVRAEQMAQMNEISEARETALKARKLDLGVTAGGNLVMAIFKISLGIYGVQQFYRLVKSGQPLSLTLVPMFELLVMVAVTWYARSRFDRRQREIAAAVRPHPLSDGFYRFCICMTFCLGLMISFRMTDRGFTHLFLSAFIALFASWKLGRFLKLFGDRS